MIKPKVVQGRTLNGTEFVSFLGYLRLWIKLKFRQWDHLLKFSIRPLLNVAWSCIMKEWAEQACQYQWINFSSFMNWQKMQLDASLTSSISVNIMLLNPSPRSMKRLKRSSETSVKPTNISHQSCAKQDSLSVKIKMEDLQVLKLPSMEKFDAGFFSLQSKFWNGLRGASQGNLSTPDVKGLSLLTYGAS